MVHGSENQFRVLQFLHVPRENPDAVWSGYIRRVDLLAEGLRARGCKVDRLHLPELHLPDRPMVANLLGWKKVRKLSQDYDVIHAAGSVCAAIGALSCRDNKTKLVFDQHGDAASECMLTWKHTHDRRFINQAIQMGLLDRIAGKWANGVLVVSKPSLELNVKRGVPRDRLQLTRNATDLEAFSVQPFRSDDGIARIGYSGTFLAWQGINNLIEAAKLLSARGWPENLRLRIIGFTNEASGIKSSLQSLLGDKFEPIDLVPREELPKLMAECDTMIIPRTPHLAVRVAMPTKFGEYVASGRSVIVTDVDETADMVNEAGCGFVADPTPEGVASAMEKVAALSRDQFELMGSRARALAEREFDWNKIAQDYFDFLCRIVGKGSCTKAC